VAQAEPDPNPGQPQATVLDEEGQEADPPRQTAEGAGGAPGTRPSGEGGGASEASTELLPAYFSTTRRGDYVAGGTGLRNRGFGTIGISGAPVGATTYKAYLYWAIIDSSTSPRTNFHRGNFRGVAISGTHIGTSISPCWPTFAQRNSFRMYVYRADVTALVLPGINGNYALTGFRSGRVDGTQPATADAMPMIDGASLVIVFNKSTYPMTQIKINNGATYLDGATPASATTTFTGLVTSNPPGPTKTTFIGADGQIPFAEPSSLVRGRAVSTTRVDWDGTDPPLPRYTAGNLWDTDTVAVGHIMRPGDTSVVVTVRQTNDCMVWVAQVWSQSPGNIDTDGDALLDGWEANGYDHNGDFVADVNLPAFGANYLKKDIFVEMDYMADSRMATVADLNRIVAVFASSPSANNPNGTSGINIHLDGGAARPGHNLGGGNLVPFDLNLGTSNAACTVYNWAEFMAVRAANFNANRARIFHYMIWAANLAPCFGSTSGISNGIPASEFIVSLDGWTSDGTPDVRVGTFIHELGHNLGLFHGGNENKNRKPNYLSVMSYNHQTMGVPRTGGIAPYFGYSHWDLPDLNENALNENVGLNSAFVNTWRARWMCGGTLTTGVNTANGPTPWNCDGDTTDNPLVRDINNDGATNTLTGHKDWGGLVYNGGVVGGVSEFELERPMETHNVDELTFEQDQEIRGLR
jgi:hypothetical protein